MTNHTSEMPLSTLERDFNELKMRGDDFFKIELLRPARSWYQKALALNPEAGDVRYQIEECDRLLKFETKVVWILVGIVTISILVYLLFF
ncbi:MAG: hypothetical protein AB9834_08095 [Lentimicrobium sp.]